MGETWSGVRCTSILGPGPKVNRCIWTLAGGRVLAPWGRPGPAEVGVWGGACINSGAAEWPQVLLTHSCVMRGKTQVTGRGGPWGRGGGFPPSWGRTDQCEPTCHAPRPWGSDLPTGTHVSIPSWGSQVGQVQATTTGMLGPELALHASGAGWKAPSPRSQPEQRGRKIQGAH